MAKKKNDAAEAALEESGVFVAPDGIVELDEKVVTDIGEVTAGGAFHFYAEDGTKLQGGGTDDGYHYIAIPKDLPEEEQNQKVAGRKRLGFRRLRNVYCQGIDATCMRIENDSHDKLLAVKKARAAAMTGSATGGGNSKESANLAGMPGTESVVTTDAV
jgi:hypothetical protein